MKPLLSIVIASRNRVPYAISAIESILEISDPRLELVVQDNSDSRELESFVLKWAHDTRLRYRYTPPPFSSIQNFNAAIELSTGEYVCLIGDDDGVNPEILEAAAWAKSQCLDALSVRTVAHYLWPGTDVRPTLLTSEPGGALSITGFRGSIVMAHLDAELRKLMCDGGSYFLNFDLPKLYHGLVHRRCLEAVKVKCGAYLGGLSPDIYSSLSIACIAQHVAVTDYPLTLPGACASSSSVTEGALKGHSTRLDDAPHFRHRGEYHWSAVVPRIYCLETIWADSGVAALQAMGRDDLIATLNLPRLAAHCAGSYRGVSIPVLRDMFSGLRRTKRSCAFGAAVFLWTFLTHAGLKVPRRIWNRLLLICGARVRRRIGGLDNMVEASHALSQYLKDTGRTFDECVQRQRREGKGSCQGHCDSEQEPDSTSPSHVGDAGFNRPIL